MFLSIWIIKVIFQNMYGIRSAFHYIKQTSVTNIPKCIIASGKLGRSIRKRDSFHLWTR